MKKADSNTVPALRVTTDFTEVPEETTQRSSKSLSVVSKNSGSQKTHLLSKRNLYAHPVYGCPPGHGKNPYISGNCANNISACKSNVSPFTQRVMSAKFLKVKQLQNELAEVQGKLTEALNENRLLRTLQKRQDSALRRYQGSQEQLPQLLSNHSEEIRALRARFKQMKDMNREFENRLKQRDNELTRLREAHSRLVKLAKDKNLIENDKMAKKIEEMEHALSEHRKEIVNLSKKLELEAKTHKHHLHTEITKHKETQRELIAAKKTIEAMKLEIEEKEFPPSATFAKKRFPVSFSNKSLPQQIPSLQALSIPTPPRVSIRQPTLSVSSIAAPIQEEPDSPTESLSTVNYSQIAGDSTSSEDISAGGRVDDSGENVMSMKASEWRKNFTNRRAISETAIEYKHDKKQMSKMSKDVLPHKSKSNTHPRKNPDSIRENNVPDNIKSKKNEVRDASNMESDASDIDGEELSKDIHHMREEMASLQLKLSSDRESEIDSMVNRVYESLIESTFENGDGFGTGDSALNQSYTDFGDDLDFNDSNFLPKSKHSEKGGKIDYDIRLEENKKADLLRALDRIDKEKVYGDSALESTTNQVSFFPVL